MSAVEKVAFVGLGNMGDPIAANLVRAGYAVTGVDAVPGRAEQWAAARGAAYAVTSADAARDADVVVTILPTSEHVAAVVDEIAPVLRPGSVVVDMTSGVPETTRRIAAGLAERDVAMVDVAVSGGVSRAVDASIALMAGGDDAVLDRVQPLLDALGRATFRTGGVGTGQAMKSLNNLVSAGGLLVAVEALLVGSQAGLDPQTMVDVLNESTGMNNATKVKLTQFVLSGSYASGFGLDLMVKDLGIALGVGEEHGVRTPLSEVLLQLWRDAAADLGPGRDHTEIARFSEHVAGVTLPRPTV
ncbi:MAG: NAD(P)-dependent oxidoreductase [Candidatus Nanopelagicales bacterium]